MRWDDRGRGGSTQFIKESTARNLRLLLTLGCRNLCELLTKEWRLFSLPYTPPRARPSPSGAPSTFSVTVARTTPLWKSTLPLPSWHPTHPEIRNDDAVQSSASGVCFSSRECEWCFYVCWYRRALLFFPTNLSQIRRVINLRRARLPCPTHLAINVAFIGTPVRPVVALFALGPRIEGCLYVVYKIDCSNFLPYLYILQSSLIQIK